MEHCLVVYVKNERERKEFYLKTFLCMPKLHVKKLYNSIQCVIFFYNLVLIILMFVAGH